MPIKKSAKKALRQSERRRKENLIWKRKMKGLEKEIGGLIKEKKTEEAKKILPKFYKTVDKAAKNNIIKKNAAARKKSRLTKLILKRPEKKIEKEIKVQKANNSKKTEASKPKA